MKCPRCGHDAIDHNDAGSEPVGVMPDKYPEFIPAGRMCCYARPNDGEPGVPNWGGVICGCSYAPPGRERYYP